MSRNAEIVAALQLAAKGGLTQFTAEELIVTAWRAFPMSLGLAGFPQYPDSNKILAAIMGKTGLVARGYLKKLGSKRYEIVMSMQPPGLAGKPVVPNELLLDAILATEAAKAFQNGRRGQLRTESLLEILDLVHNKSWAEPAKALEKMRSRLTELDRADEPSPKLRLVRNLVDSLVGSFFEKLEVCSNRRRREPE